MQTGLSLLSELTETDIDWILSSGSEQQVIANTVVIQDGQAIDSLWIVLAGLLDVKITSLCDISVGSIGPGEILGELSFLENTVASATVTAVESSLLLAVSRKVLDLKLSADPCFAARLYRSFALLGSRRLKERVSALGQALHHKREITEAVSSKQKGIGAAMEEFKRLMSRADAEALKNDHVVPRETVAEIRRAFSGFFLFLNEAIGDGSSASSIVKQEFGSRVQRELLPYILLTRTCERMYSKPRGYAGDFLTIEMLYQNKPEGIGRLGPVVDECFLNALAGQAVRHRRGLLAQSIHQVLADNEGEPARITSLACGPAAEVFDVFSGLEDKTRLSANLIDIDMQALAFVDDKRARTKLQRQMSLINGNLLYLAMGKEKLDLKPQDLIYSIGLIDYFNDKCVIKLLDYIHGLLKPGGRVIVGNFHPKNPDKAMMDYLLDWRLTHRSEDDMNRIFSESLFKQPCSRIRFEATGINLFAEGIRE